MFPLQGAWSRAIQSEMACVISFLKFVYFLLNTITMLSSALYFGFGIFMLISRRDPIGLGLDQISIILIASGGAILTLSFLGYCAGTGRRAFFMHFFSLCLLLLAIYEFAFGILIAVRHAKANEYMSKAWGDMPESGRAAFETAFNCCGYKSPTDRSSCPDSKIESSPACYAQLSTRQELLLNYLAIGLFCTAMISVSNYFTSYLLATQYTKDKARFRNLQLERERAKGAPLERRSAVRSSKSPEGSTVGSEDEIQRSVSVHEERMKPKTKMAFLPHFLRPVPKPTLSVSQRGSQTSAGSQLTYDEIVAKYRGSTFK